MKSLVKELDGTKESIRDALQEAEYYSTLSGFGKEQVLQIVFCLRNDRWQRRVVLRFGRAFWIEIKENTVQMPELQSAGRFGIEEARTRNAERCRVGRGVLYQESKEIHQALDLMAFRAATCSYFGCNGYPVRDDFRVVAAAVSRECQTG